MKWAFSFTGRDFGFRWLWPMVLGPVVYLVLSFFFASELGVAPEFGRGIAVAILVFLAAFYFAVPGALYLYTVLAGGVMSRAERARRDKSADF